MNTASQMRIRDGGWRDLPTVLALLNSARLPTSDLESAASLQTWVLESAGTSVGVIALERYGNQGLLRSLAVLPEFRQHGFGRDLVLRLERDSRKNGIEQLVLLTETAERFFQKLDYLVIDRALVHEDVKRSAEFRSLCPASAVCMHKSLAVRASEPTL
jgi:amino-acid N-acetyltransferase